jgi:tRNA(fMet)-specific endonuclease VapC
VPKYVLDTNAVSGLMSRNAAVIARLEQATRAAVLVPMVVWAEIAFGVERLAEGKKQQLLRGRFELLRSELPRAEWTDEVTDAFGRIKASLEKRGQRLEDFDVAVAAHALVADAVLVSANTKHMARISDIRLEDWSK